MLGLTGFQTTGNNDLRVMDAIRREIDTKGLPPVSAPSPLEIRNFANYLRLEWSGGGTLETTTNLADWISLPWTYSPFLEPNQVSIPSGSFFRIRR